MKKRSRSKFIFVLTNILLSLAIAQIVFIILNYYNPKLGFITSTYSIVISAALAVVAVIVSVYNIVRRAK